ncbi:MAG: transposase [Cytophagales bacterium]|nr:transposase [Cytophagales bacterium]
MQTFLITNPKQRGSSSQAAGYQLCIAHLLRDLEYLGKRYEHSWPEECKKLFLNSFELKKILQPEQYKSDCPKSREIGERMDRLLEISIDEKHKELVTFIKRLKKYRNHLFVFLDHLHVPADNNGSERTIRNVKVKQKISGQFRSNKGAQNFATLRSVVDTLVKQSIHILPNLKLIAKLTPE